MNHEILTKEQTALLKRVGSTEPLQKRFYLTGGTPLAVFYLHHRYSEDLDFFSENEVDTATLNVFFKKAKNELGIKEIDFEQSFNRNLFFLRFKNGVLKIEFTFFPFPRIQRGATQFGVEVDSLLDIAVNKLFTVYQRTKARDYIDLYFICRDYGFAIGDLINKARIKFDTNLDLIQLGSQFVRATEVWDFPRMISKIAPNEWQSFFIEEAKKFKSEVIE